MSPADATALPTTFGQPTVRIDLPPGVGVAERSVMVNFATFRPMMKPKEILVLPGAAPFARRSGTAVGRAHPPHVHSPR
ncbi:MAG: hypothetical protein QM699_18850 [Amaricoccus sp.]|uniref:hypothetical protein n=1 Tax=Amaricoccus sp. TaxID=1872485 RepID=UPI0039E5A98D